MRRDDYERGETLVEILVTLSILGIGIVALLSALTTNVAVTGLNRDQSQAGAVLSSAAEHVKSLSTVSNSCSGGAPTTIDAADVPRPPGFTLTFGPNESVEGQPCTQIVAVPVRVTGNGFDRTVRVVRRS